MSNSKLTVQSSVESKATETNKNETIESKAIENKFNQKSNEDDEFKPIFENFKGKLKNLSKKIPKIEEVDKKTKPCTYGPECTLFPEGLCPYGDHSKTDPTLKGILCKFNKDCTNRKCLYDHDKLPCKYGDKCQNKKCKFDHSNTDSQNESIPKKQCTKGKNCLSLYPDACFNIFGTTSKCEDDHTHIPICKNDGNCMDMQCPCKHTSPKETPCSWKGKCTKENCLFGHPTKVQEHIDSQNEILSKIKCPHGTNCLFWYPDICMDTFGTISKCKKDHSDYWLCKYDGNCTKRWCHHVHTDPSETVCVLGHLCPRGKDCFFKHLLDVEKVQCYREPQKRESIKYPPRSTTINAVDSISSKKKKNMTTKIESNPQNTKIREADCPIKTINVENSISSQKKKDSTTKIAKKQYYPRTHKGTGTGCNRQHSGPNNQ